MNVDLIRKIKGMGKPIAYNPLYVSIGCTVKSAILLSQIVYWSSKKKEFYKTVDQWREETGLSERSQRHARDNLISLGLISEQKKGIPCRIFFSLNSELLYEKLCAFVGSLPSETVGKDKAKSKTKNSVNVLTSSDESVVTVLTKAQNKAIQNVATITENTTENTTEIKNKNKKTKKINGDDFDFENALISLGIESQYANEFMLSRKNFNRPPRNTKTTFDLLAKQINKSVSDYNGLTPNDLILICIYKGWIRFESTWDWQKSIGVIGKYINGNQVLIGDCNRSNNQFHQNTQVHNDKQSYRNRIQERSQDNSLDDFLREHNVQHIEDLTDVTPVDVKRIG